MLSRMQFGCYLVIDNCLYVPTDVLPMYQIYKAIGQLVMKILHFKDMGVTNAVVLVLEECQISMATYIGGGGTLI